MTPSEAFQHLQTILATLDRLIPAFRAAEDRAVLGEARLQIDSVAWRLHQDMVQDEAYFEANPIP